MRNLTKFVSAVTCLCFSLSSCAHSVSITSAPPGADVQVNGNPIGKTPCVLTEKTGSGRTSQFTVSKHGYDTLSLSYIQSDVNSGVVIGSIIGGVLILIPFIGLIWMYQLPDNLRFELVPSPTEQTALSPSSNAESPGIPVQPQHTEVLSPPSDDKRPKTILLLTQSATVFSGPGGVHDSLGTLPIGARIHIIKEENDWCCFTNDSFPNGDAWVDKSFTSAQGGSR